MNRIVFDVVFPLILLVVFLVLAWPFLVALVAMWSSALVVLGAQP